MRSLIVLMACTVVPSAACSGPDADGESTGDNDTTTGDARERIDGTRVDITCTVVGEEGCSEDCVPVRSVPRWLAGIGEECIRSGVFFGCTPAPDSGYWGGNISTAQSGLCTHLPPPDPFLYCFDGRGDISWVLSHAELFCGLSHGDCMGEVEFPPACYEDVPDDNISPIPHYGDPSPPFDWECARERPMPTSCYTE